jgi:hypothetical protein
MLARVSGTSGMFPERSVSDQSGHGRLATVVVARSPAGPPTRTLTPVQVKLVLLIGARRLPMRRI